MIKPPFGLRDGKFVRWGVEEALPLVTCVVFYAAKCGAAFLQIFCTVPTHYYAISDISGEFDHICTVDIISGCVQW